jgi:hypothetical protein
MAKEGWRRGSRGDEIGMPRFRDPVSGKVLPQNPQGETSQVGGDSTATKNRDGLT